MADINLNLQRKVISVNLKGGTGGAGQTGPAGASAGVLLGFSNNASDSDPGAGVIRINNSDYSLANRLFIDNTSMSGHALQTLLDQWDDSTSGIKGQVHIRQVGDDSRWATFNVTGAVIDGAGYRKIPVVHVASLNAFTHGATVSVLFVRTGDKGDPGTPGGVGSAGLDGNDGWTPVLATVADGVRRVLQVVDWTGGEGAKPTTGLYVGPAGLTATIASATDIRGASGAGTGDVLGPATHAAGRVPLWAGANSKTLVEGRAIGVAAADNILDRQSADTRYAQIGQGSSPSIFIPAVVADGVTNDQPVIQAALDAAAVAGGGVVVLPEGTILLDVGGAGATDGCLRLGNNVVLSGAGPRSTILKAKNAVAHAIDGIVRTIAGQVVIGAGVEHLSIDGNKANNGTTSIMGLVAGHTTPCEFIFVRDVEVRDCRAHGLHFNGVAGFVLEDVVASGNGGSAAHDNISLHAATMGRIANLASATSGRWNLYIGAGSSDIDVYSLLARNAVGAGVVVESAGYIRFWGPTIRNNGAQGMLCQRAASGGGFPYDISVIGGSVRSNLAHGLHSAGAQVFRVDGVEIESNGESGVRANYSANAGGGASLYIDVINCPKIYNNGEHGILYRGVNQGRIANNTLINNGVDTHNTFDGIRLEDDTNGGTARVQIIDNSITSTGAVRQRYGVSEAGASGLNMVMNNIIEGAQTAAILMIHANSNFGGNILDGVSQDTLIGRSLRQAATQAAARAAIGATGLGPTGVRTLTADGALVLADAFGRIRANEAGELVLTIPPQSSVAWPDNTEVEVLIVHASGSVRIAAGTGVTVWAHDNQVALTGRGGVLTLVRDAADSWVVVGGNTT